MSYVLGRGRSLGNCKSELTWSVPDQPPRQYHTWGLEYTSFENQVEVPIKTEKRTGMDLAMWYIWNGTTTRKWGMFIICFWHAAYFLLVLFSSPAAHISPLFTVHQGIRTMYKMSNGSMNKMIDSFLVKYFCKYNIVKRWLWLGSFLHEQIGMYSYSDKRAISWLTNISISNKLGELSPTLYKFTVTNIFIYYDVCKLF